MKKVIRKIRITPELYAAIFAEIGGSLSVLSTFTDMDGTSPMAKGTPHIYTGWGIVGDPLLEYEKVGEKEYFRLLTIHATDDD